MTDEAQRDRLTSLARKGKQTGWWQSYDLDFATYVGLEAEATGIRFYQSAIVPGLMQTPRYARAMAPAVGAILVRDSKNPDGAVLGYPAVSWRSFPGRAKQGNFDISRLSRF